jgi:hypothetical protein
MSSRTARAIQRNHTENPCLEKPKKKDRKKKAKKNKR